MLTFLFEKKKKKRVKMSSAAAVILVLTGLLHCQNSLTLCRLGNFACFFVVCRPFFFFFFLLTFFFQKIFQDYHQSVKQFGFRSDPTKCRA